ncbi:minor capsid protein [Bacilliculturomica massiliensis]|uniref:minor capsid protein n=1 Tax=Bacilliculturomica massiliensis TaxID=1917867 RepID=UPI00102FDD98|nr:minor capsid protein [Bacilliculturomica massiliensis]
MKNSAYWRKRFAKLEESLLNKGEAYMVDLDREFKKATASIEKDLAIWYQRMADNNGISLQEAKRLLDAKELEEFKWTVEEYIRAGRENAIDQRWLKELENASARIHISRLEAVKLQLQQQAEALYGNHLDDTDALLRNIYTEGYYRTAFEIQRAAGVGWTMAAIDVNRIDKVLSKPWAADGSNFSARIWKDRTKLVDELHTQLTQMIIRGEAPDRAIKAIAKRFGVGKMRAGTLVMTESAFFASASQRDCFNDLGVERYELVETLDSQTCGVCGDLDGKVFKMSDFKVGVTAPPFHPRCRGTTCPYFNDEFTEGEVRAARGKDGKTTMVPNMTYKEWRKQYVSEGGLGAGGGAITSIAPPKFVERIDRDNTALVESKLREYEALIRDSNEEHAYVILKNGKVYHFVGDKNGVNPLALGEVLNGSIMTHNHPAGSNNEYSFSNQDIGLFRDCKLAKLRGIDEKYIYELSRESKSVEPSARSVFEIAEGDGRHEKVKQIAKDIKVGYWRKKRD